MRRRAHTHTCARTDTHHDTHTHTLSLSLSPLFRPYSHSAPWRVPKRFWDLYDDDEIALAKHQLPPTDMPGVAWHQQGFYNATDGSPHVPSVNVPLPVAIQREMRHAYYSAVSWLDHQIGTVLKELDTLGLTDSTIVLLHGDHGWQVRVSFSAFPAHTLSLCLPPSLTAHTTLSRSHSLPPSPSLPPFCPRLFNSWGSTTRGTSLQILNSARGCRS